MRVVARRAARRRGAPAVRDRWSPRSRSPSRNHDSPPNRATCLERVPRLVRSAPAAFLVREAGQRVEDAVEVRRDVQAEDAPRSSPTLPITVTSRGSIDVDEPAQEARAADAAAEDDDLHRVPVDERLGQRRRRSLRRSSIESTSSARFGIAAGQRRRRRASARARGSARRSRGRRAGRRATAGRGRARSSSRRARRRGRSPCRRRGLEPVEVARHDARDVGVHDEHRSDSVTQRRPRRRRPVRAPGRRRRERRAPSRGHAASSSGGDDDGRRRPRGGGEDVLEHREPERLALVVRERAEALLATRPAERNDDRRHRSWRLSAWRTRRSRRSSRRSRRCSS